MYLPMQIPLENFGMLISRSMPFKTNSGDASYKKGGFRLGSVIYGSFIRKHLCSMKSGASSYPLEFSL